MKYKAVKDSCPLPFSRSAEAFTGLGIVIPAAEVGIDTDKSVECLTPI